MGKTFINQSFSKKAVINGKMAQIYGWISQPRFTMSKIHLLRDTTFGEDCLSALRILKIITVGLKMDSCNAIKNSYML